MKKKIIALCTPLAFLLLLSFIMIAESDRIENASAASSTTSNSNRIPNATPVVRTPNKQPIKATTSKILGFDAIVPSQGTTATNAVVVNGSSSAAISSSNSPHFTEGDVRKYFMNRSNVGFLTSRTKLKVEKVEFITVSQIEEKVSSGNGSDEASMLGISGDTIECLVTLSGDFRIAPPPSQDSNKHDYTFQKVYVIIDAQTGNVLQTRS